MKKVGFVLSALFLVLGLFGCRSETPEPTQPAEITAPVPLIQNGTSEYVIVHDSTKATTLLAEAIKSAVREAYGVDLTVAAAKDTPEGGCEIVLGKSRPVGEELLETFTKEFDFALKTAGKQLVLCAANDVSYRYLRSYLTRETLKKTGEGSLTLDEDDQIVYSQSALYKMNLVDYLLSGNESFELTELFSYGEYKEGKTLVPYRVYVPFNYSPEKSYPIFVNLHGAGHRGVSNESQMRFVMPLLKNAELGLDEMIMIFPQCPSDQKWVDTNWSKGSYSVDEVPESDELAALVTVIGQITEKYSVDEKRIYACGLSMGGYGTWNLLMNHSDLFCGGIPMCGAGDPTKADILKDLAIWAVHGAKDPTVPVEGSRDMADALKAVNAENFRYTELANHEHDVWNYTYSNMEIFQWLFSQKKP